VQPHPNPNMLQQQPEQHPQQQSQGDPHSLQGIPNTDRMWSAIEQRRSQNGSEMAASQGNPQVSCRLSVKIASRFLCGSHRVQALTLPIRYSSFPHTNMAVNLLV
jgi:hypothetical protein